MKNKNPISLSTSVSSSKNRHVKPTQQKRQIDLRYFRTIGASIIPMTKKVNEL
jgi:hypothetical protein